MGLRGKRRWRRLSRSNFVSARVCLQYNAPRQVQELKAAARAPSRTQPHSAPKGGSVLCAGTDNIMVTVLWGSLCFLC